MEIFSFPVLGKSSVFHGGLTECMHLQKKIIKKWEDSGSLNLELLNHASSDLILHTFKWGGEV